MPKSNAPFVPPSGSRQLEQWMQQALALHQSGRAGEAETLYRQVLARQASHPAANHLLGLVRLQQGNAGAAVELIARAVAARPQDPQYHCNLGVALNAAGRPQPAVESFERAIELKRDYAEAHSNRGMALKNLGRAAEAVESYRQALALKPKEAGFHLNLGNALNALGDMQEAEASYRRALALRPGYPAALSGLSLTLEALGRADEAISAGEAAVAGKPRQSEYHRSVGRAYRAAGRLHEAIASYRKALALNPADTEIYRLISLALRRNGVDEDMAAMERLYADPQTSREQRVHLAFALGQGFDDIGAYDKSFERFAEGNRLMHETAPYPLDEAREDLRIIRGLFEALPEPLLHGGYGESAPIFILGLPRAGKTSLEHVLRRHPHTHAAGELRLMSQLVRELSMKHGLTLPGADLGKVPVEEFADLGRRYAEWTRALAGGANVVIDTMPPNFRLIGFIRLALPNARIIHCIRDPLEHCVALFQKYFAGPGYEYTYDAGVLASYHNLYREMMARWHEAFPGFIMDVDLQDLRAAPEAQLRRLVAFCGLEWNNACLEFSESEPRIGDPVPPEPSTPAHLAPYRPLFAPLLA